MGRLPSPLETKPLKLTPSNVKAANLSVASKTGAPKWALPLRLVPDCEIRMVNAPVPNGVVIVPVQLPAEFGVCTPPPPPPEPLPPEANVRPGIMLIPNAITSVITAVRRDAPLVLLSFIILFFCWLFCCFFPVFPQCNRLRTTRKFGSASFSNGDATLIFGEVIGSEEMHFPCLHNALRRVIVLVLRTSRSNSDQHRSDRGTKFSVCGTRSLSRFGSPAGNYELPANFSGFCPIRIRKKTFHRGGKPNALTGDRMKTISLLWSKNLASLDHATLGAISVSVAAALAFVGTVERRRNYPVRPVAGERSKGGLRLLSKERAMNHLAASKSGRMLLHAICLLRHPNHSRWHWKGIMREFAS